VAETNAVAWREQPAVGKVPMPQVPGLPRLGPATHAELRVGSTSIAP